jgi:A/G-specific adenine glycosylase
MLQQTRVETVIPYYRRWLSRFPTVDSLANAEIDDVLGIWEGLGYYQRAHNLHQAAKVILDQYDGQIPRGVHDLESLPGIGPYTAAAIASIAFGEQVVALDGNLRRIISRLINFDQIASTPEADRRFRTWAIEQIPASSASEFNQALMDLGAMVCTAKAPTCVICPVSSHCEAFAQDVQESRPVRKVTRAIPHHVVSAGVLRKDGKVLIGRRPVGKLLGGLWEFPGGKCFHGESIADCLEREWYEELDLVIVPGKEIGVIEHAYTHFKVTVHAVECHAQEYELSMRDHSEIRWVEIDRLDEFPMGKVDRVIATMIRV